METYIDLLCWLLQSEVVLSKLSVILFCSNTANIMAQLLQPLFILALIITLIYQPKGVKSLAHTDFQTLMDIKNSATRSQLKEIWNNN